MPEVIEEANGHGLRRRRAWGTAARAETNVHLSISGDTKTWDEVRSRIIEKGVGDIVSAVNRRQWEWVYDPEI